MTQVPVPGVGAVPVGLPVGLPGVLPGVGALPVGLLLPGAVGAIEVWGHRAVAVLPVGVAVLPLGRASFVPVPEWPQALPYCREEPAVAHLVGVA